MINVLIKFVFLYENGEDVATHAISVERRFMLLCYE